MKSVLLISVALLSLLTSKASAETTYLVLLESELATPTQLASLYSEAFWKLCVNTDGATTKYLCGHIVHPTTGAAALEMGDTWWPLSETGDPTTTVGLLGYAATDEQKAELFGHLTYLCKVKARINLANLIPDHFAPLVKTRAELEALGWFAEENM